MAIVTLSRGTFSGGARLATCLAANLGLRALSREVLVDAARIYGVDADELVSAMEKPPSFWDRFRTDRQLYLAAVTATLCRSVRDDHVVYHGHAGHLLLSGIDNVLRVRVIAPLPSRIAEAIADHGFDADEAEAYIRRKDSQRAAWNRFLYRADWRDPQLYDLVVNLERITTEAACAIIASLIERPEYAMTEAHVRAIDDLYMENHVLALLFRNAKVGSVASSLEVVARGGEIYLSGILPAEHFRDEILRTVRDAEGVRTVHAEALGARLVTG